MRHRILKGLARLASGRDSLAEEAFLESRNSEAPGASVPEAEREEALAERREMIKGVQELGETLVKEVMVPRIDALFLPLDIGREELLERVASSGHSRIPVYRDSVDEVVGILYAKDLLRSLVVGGGFALADIVRKPYFVPETKRIDALLREMKRSRVHIAVVVDEYGGVSGIAFLEDIIEEIVGEIDDEFDEARQDIVPSGDSIWLCDGMVDLDDLNAALGLSLPADGFETLGGFLFDLFGRIPSPSESVRSGGAEFTVQEMNGNRITSVKIRKIGLGEA
jgi:CBS domain containing-hemolysin-like protein